MAHSEQRILAHNVCGDAIVRSLDQVSIKTTEWVKKTLQAASYVRAIKWAYSIHEHHFYPKWLGGLDSGPKLRVRGLEHITDLEPALLTHMQRAIPGLTERTAANVQRLIRNGSLTQERITQALFDFYKGRYSALSDDTIINALRAGI